MWSTQGKRNRAFRGKDLHENNVHRLLGVIFGVFPRECNTGMSREKTLRIRAAGVASGDVCPV